MYPSCWEPAALCPANCCRRTSRRSSRRWIPPNTPGGDDAPAAPTPGGGADRRVRVESRLLRRPRPTLALVGRGLLRVLPLLGIGIGRLIGWRRDVQGGIPGWRVACRWWITRCRTGGCRVAAGRWGVRARSRVDRPAGTAARLLAAARQAAPPDGPAEPSLLAARARRPPPGPRSPSPLLESSSLSSFLGSPRGRVRAETRSAHRPAHRWAWRCS